MLKHISLKVKLLISFLIVACVVLTVGWVGYTSINKMTEKTTTIVETVPLIDAAMEMKFALARGTQVVMEMVTSTSTVELNNALSDYKAMRDLFDKFAEAIVNGAETSEGLIVATTDERLREIVKQADDLHNKEFNSRALRIHELMLDVLSIQDQQKQLVVGSDVFVKNRQKIEGLTKVINNLDFEADQSAETVLEILGEIEVRSRANIAAAVKASDDVAEVSQSTAVTGIVVGFTLALVIGFFLNYTISHPITRITNAAKAIANGDLNQELDVTSSDEIGVLANAMN
ncbi:MAG: HAMP domain-containing protein, partial [Calditrichaeota bacterium]|nr:HAMP domain-containing protein [Calditrichota bacterium]